MNIERWRHIDDLFQAALAQPSFGRERFVAAQCAGDDSLRREIESLLSAHERDGLLNAPVSQVASDLLFRNEPAVEPGDRLGPYGVIQRLGSGGMGDVYVAEDPRLGRRVALKVLHSAPHHAPGGLDRLAREARAASSLNHPNIAVVYDVGCAGDHHYIATEMVEGETLRARMGSAIEAAEACGIAIQIASALEAAHDAGIVHRDIKPENVMVRSDGVVKVVDFGLAKRLTAEARRASTAQTLPGVVLGTTPYMSPEQAQGRDVDGRSDIFSLGVVMFEMLAGRLPFGGSTVAATIASILKDDPPDILRRRQVPLELERIIPKTLRKNPQERHQHMRELLAELRSISRGGRNARNRGAAAAAVLTVIVGALVSASYTASPPTKSPRDESATHRLYVKGQFFRGRSTLGDIRRSIEYFQQAVRVDPDYAPGYAGLAHSYLSLSGNPGAPAGPPLTYLAQARTAALHALRLDSANVEAQVVMATVKQSAYWDWNGAEQEFKRALALDPGYAPAHYRYGLFLAFMRRFDEAIARLDRAEQLDPVSVSIAANRGTVYVFARQPDRAIAQLQQALEIDPRHPHARFNLAAAYEQKGMFAEAAALFDDPALNQSNIYARIGINRFRVLAGRPAETEAILREVLQSKDYVAPLYVAELYAMLDNEDEAFRWLEKAYEDGGWLIPRLYADPSWERFPLSRDRRFAALLRRAGLPPHGGRDTPPADPTAAHELYVKGRFFWNKRTIAGLETSIKYFEEALKIHPTHAPAYAGLADSYLAFTGNPAAPGPPPGRRARPRPQPPLATPASSPSESRGRTRSGGQ